MLRQAPRTAQNTFRWYIVLMLIVASGIFLVDTLTPLDTAVAVLYVAVIIASPNFLSRRGILAVGGMCLFLTIASFAIVHGDSLGSGPIIRCLVSLSAIVVTTFLALKNQEATQDIRYQATLLDLSHDAIFVRDERDMIVYWNAGAEELYGWKRAEVIGRNATEFLRTKFPMATDAIIRELHANDRWQGELIHTKRDGSEVVVASRWSLQRDERKRPFATMETNNDMTERRRSEDALHKAQSELSHVARVATLGELTASIAHEVNQPLAAVVTNGEACLRWLLRDVPDLKEVRSSVERMIGNGRRASDVIARLRALSRKGDAVWTKFDMNEIVADVLPLVDRELFRHDIELNLGLNSSPLPVSGDRVQLQQVVINLLMNAIQAMSAVEDRSRILSISTGLVSETNHVFLEVRDTGTGIKPGSVAELFNAFFTTKSDGMGMGLSICRSIIEAHGGRISVLPGSGQGAAFVLNLPIQQEIAA